MIYKAFEESLHNANKATIFSNDQIYASFQKKLTEAPTREKAGFWYPKVVLIKKLSDDVVIYIDGLKDELEKSSNNNSKGKDNYSVIHLFVKNEKGKELWKKLNRYLDDLFSMDSQLHKTFINTIAVLPSSFDSTKQDFTRNYFENSTVPMALAILRMFQNNIRYAESRTILFCHEQIGTAGDHIKILVPLVSQSHSFIRLGETLEITAGIAAYSSSVNPEIFINGVKMHIQGNGFALYKIRAGKTVGKHNIPVMINYIDEFGHKLSMSKIISYVVAKDTVRQE